MITQKGGVCSSVASSTSTSELLLLDAISYCFTSRSVPSNEALVPYSMRSMETFEQVKNALKVGFEISTFVQMLRHCAGSRQVQKPCGVIRLNGV